jgi:hypothetical protein
MLCCIHSQRFALPSVRTLLQHLLLLLLLLLSSN